MVVHDPGHALESQVIMQDRECPGCGYNLKGLRRGGKCPECGRAIGGKPRGRLMSDITHATPSYLKTIRVGLSLVCVSILGACVPFLGAALFAGGVWITLTKRPVGETTAPDWLLDSDSVRAAARGLSFGALAGTGLAFAGGVLGGVAGAALEIGAGLCLIAGAVGFIPLCAYLSALADWASYDTVASRLRATTWLIVVGGTATAVLWTIPATRFFALWAAMALIAAFIIFLLSVFQLTGAISWSLSNQKFAEGSAARVAEARAKREAAPNAVHGLRCRRCKFDLEGLPLGGVCPECGESYADETGLPVRELPVRSPEDEAPIPLADDDTPEVPKQIRHARHLSDPNPEPESDT